MSNSYENMKKFLSLLFLIAFAITIQNTYAETFSIEPVSGSGAPGCEETLQGCYTPKELIIHVGDIVKFTNTDTASHTFTSGTPEGGTSGIFDSGLTTGGGGVSYSPDAVGDIPYWCVVHPWMVGVIKVVDYDDSTEIQYSRTHVESANIFSETESTISFGIDRSKYFINDSISIIGNLNYFVADEKPIIIILNPSGGIVYEKQVNIENKRFYDLVHTADSDFTKNGIYEIIISYDNEVDSKLSFDFSNNVPTSSKNITYYLSTSTINKIPLNANLVNVDFLSLSTFNQKGKLQFTLVPDLITQAKETITLDIPRKII